MSIGFGFSIGDFIAVSDLARRIAQALDDARGATADYKDLCELLLSLSHALHTASAVFFCPPSKSGTLPDTATFNAIRHELGCCKRLMDDFLDTSRKYTEALLNGRGKRIMNEWRKIQWSLYKLDDVRKLHANLQGHFSALQLYNITITWQGLARIEQKATENSDTGHRIESRVTEVFVLLKMLHENLTCTGNKRPALALAAERREYEKPWYYFIRHNCIFEGVASLILC